MRRAAVAALLLLLAGCAMHRPVPGPASLACRTTLPGPQAASVSWAFTAPSTATLDAWCDGVGPAVVDSRPPRDVASDQVTIASWNVHVGGGDLEAFVDAVARSRDAGLAPGDLVVLVQEAYRGGDAVPPLADGARAAEPIGRRTTSAPDDTIAAARRLGLSIAYVPSMRNGAGRREDRGSAVIATRPLDEVTAYELPLGHQRRVAVGATVRGVTRDGRPWSLRVVSVHLDTRPAPRIGWLFAPRTRERQMRALVGRLPTDAPVVLGGDLNTWMGTREPALAVAERWADMRVPADAAPTAALRMRLDHLFFRRVPGVIDRVRRLPSRFGSDHHPIVAVLRMN